MNREIKFRIWDGAKFLISSFSSYSNISWSLIELIDDEMRNIDGADYAIQQFTGLKDKNGKEIYEGDVVECANGLPYLAKHGFWKHVDCLEQLYGWHFKGLYCDWEWEMCENCKVVGNIFENPELIKS